MATEGLQVFSIREYKLDLTENARITNPGSFRKLENLYSKNPGSIDQIPGSVLFASKVVVGQLAMTAATDNGTKGLPGDVIKNIPDTYKNPVDLSDLIFEAANKNVDSIANIPIVDLTHPVLTTVPGASKFALPAVNTVVWSRSWT